MSHPRPLEGVKVVELATFVAATSCARYLADLGADTIKVEAPSGDPLRYTAVNEGRPAGEKENTSFDLDNANKKGVVLNLKSEKGKEAFLKLLEDADIFITNTRQKALERLGIDYETLKQKFPALVMGFVSGYGEKGPDKDLPGFDFTSYYARGGVLGTMRDKNSLPMLTVQGFGDHQVAMNLASGVLAALYRAKTTGKGDKVTVSLLHSAIWDVGIMLQAAQYGHKSTQFPLARNEVANPFQLAYKTKDDRYIQIAMPRYDFHYPIFMKVMGRDDLVDDPRYYPQSNLQENLAEFYDIVVEEMAKKTVAEWTQLLTEADIPFALAQTWDELLEDKQAWASDCFYAMKYPTGATRTLVRPPVVFEDTALPPYERGPYLGEHTEEILQKVGYSEAEIKSMIENKDVKGYTPDGL